MMKQVQSDIQQLIDEGNMYAEDFLAQSGEFYPFAFVIGKDGSIQPAVYQREIMKTQDSKSPTIDFKNTLNGQLKSGKARSYGIVYNMQVEVDERGAKSDAIVIEIFHQDDTDIPIYYFPYKLGAKGKITYSESFAIHR